VQSDNATEPPRSEVWAEKLAGYNKGGVQTVDVAARRSGAAAAAAAVAQTWFK
jgi:hypothetical protein